MSAVATKPKRKEEAPPPTLAERYGLEEGQELTDGATVDETAFDQAVALIRETAAKGADAFRQASQAYRAWASARVAARLTITMPDGRPDWGGKSDAYRLIVKREERLAMGFPTEMSEAQATEYRRIDSNIRNYTKEAVQRAVEERVGKDNPDTPATVKDGSPSAAFSKLVGEQYDETGFSVPEKYRRVPRTDTGGPESGEPLNVLVNVNEAAKLLRPVDFLNRSHGILQILVDLREELLAAEAVNERPKVIAVLEHLNAVAFATVKVLSGNTLSKDEQSAVDTAISVARPPKDQD